MRRTDLVLVHRGGTSSSEKGLAYPVLLQNRGGGTFWDVDIRATHDGEETDRQTVHKVDPQSETDQVFLLVPARFCDKGTPGIGLRPLGLVSFEALIAGEVVAATEPLGQPPEPAIDRVPRTPDEEAALLRARPDGWEYLLFAAVLRRRMDALESKYRDHRLRFIRPSPGSPPYADESDFFISAFRDARVLTDNFNRLFDNVAQDRAFGVPGESGDPAEIEHVASRMIDVYEGLIDWAARVRATPLDDEFNKVVELASRFVDQPIQQFRDFVERVVAETDQLPAALRAESPGPITLTLTITLSIEEGLEDELHGELRRLEAMYGGGAFDA
jgi:hypothetical protein